MFFNQTFKLFFDDGTVVETDDLLSWIYQRTKEISNPEEFYYRMKWLCKYQKSSFYNNYYSSYYDTQFVRTFFLYTKNNIMVSPELFKSEYHKDCKTRWNKKRNWCTHWRNGHTTTYDRKMKTMAERRAIAGVLKEEGEPEFRGRRRIIPHPWDDIMARRSLSWKDCTKRKRQHKGR